MLGIGAGYWILEGQWVVVAIAVIYVLVYYRPPGNGRHQATPPGPPDTPDQGHNRLADPEYGGGPAGETDTGWLRRITSDVDVRQLPAAATAWCGRRWHTGDCCPASRWHESEFLQAASPEVQQAVAHIAVTGEPPPPVDVGEAPNIFAALAGLPPPVDVDEPPAFPPPVPFALTRKLKEATARIRRLDGLDHRQLLDVCITVAGVDEGAQLLDDALAMLGR